MRYQTDVERCADLIIEADLALQQILMYFKEPEVIKHVKTHNQYDPNCEEIIDFVSKISTYANAIKHFYEKNS